MAQTESEDRAKFEKYVYEMWESPAYKRAFKEATKGMARRIDIPSSIWMR